MDEIGSITKGLIWKGVWTKRETVRNTDDIVKTVCGKTKVNILYVLDKDKKKMLQACFTNLANKGQFREGKNCIAINAMHSNFCVVYL